MTKQYISRDLYLAVYLDCVGHDCNLEKEAGDDRFSFIFEDTDKLKDDMKKYDRQDALVDPMKLFT